MKLNIAEFRLLFPMFDYVKDEMLNVQFKIAQHYITNFSEDNQYKAMLMIAHLLYIKELLDSGDQSVIVTSASESDVVVALAQPPRSSNFLYWLNVSSFGLQLLSLLEIEGMGGLFIGGSPELSTFRYFNGNVS